MGRAHEVRAASMAKTAAFKSKQNAKYGALIFKAAKSGIPDPDLNQVLKREIEKAKKAQIPADVIKRAIDKAKGGSADDYTEVLYEGFGPNNSMIMVECLTDNPNRTFTEVRTVFSRSGCKLGVSGSVSHMFTNQAIFSFEGLTEEETLEILLTADCDVTDIQYDDGMVSVFAPSSEYAKVRDALTDYNPDIEFLEDGVVWTPMMYVTLEDHEDIKQIEKLKNSLDDLDDVQNIYHNIEGLDFTE